MCRTVISTHRSLYFKVTELNLLYLCLLWFPECLKSLSACSLGLIVDQREKGHGDMLRNVVTWKKMLLLLFNLDRVL